MLRKFVLFQHVSLCALSAFAILLGFATSSSARRFTDETGRVVDVPDHPQRIVSLAPSITEMVYALGLDDRLVANTDYCDYPPAARKKPHVGALISPSLEKIVDFRPDLVLATTEANRLPTVTSLERLGIPVYTVSARSVAEALGSIVHVGEAVGEAARGRALAESLSARVKAVREAAAQRGVRPRVLFVVWYYPLITVGAKTFIHDTIELAGGRSLSGDLGGSWPRLSLEEVLRRDPDVILFPRTEASSPTVEQLRRLAGWRDLRAVKGGRVYFVSDAITHPSPRLIDSLEEVSRILGALR